jgi:hypothetical protein
MVAKSFLNPKFSSLEMSLVKAQMKLMHRVLYQVLKTMENKNMINETTLLLILSQFDSNLKPLYFNNLGHVECDFSEVEYLIDMNKEAKE